MEPPSRAPMYFGVFLLVCGWAVIVIGWWQAGRQDLETGQLPYVISGGFGGFGLLFMGATAVLLDVVRQAEWKLRRSAEDLHGRLEEIATSFARQRVPGAAPAQGSGGGRPRRRRRRRPASSREEGSERAG